MDLQHQRKIIHNYARSVALKHAIRIEDDRRNSILVEILTLSMIPRLKKFVIDDSILRSKKLETLQKCKAEITNLLTQATQQPGSIGRYESYLKDIAKKTKTITQQIKAKSEMVRSTVNEHNQIAGEMAGAAGAYYADVKMVTDISTAILGIVPGAGACNRAAAAVVLPMIGETIALTDKLIRTNDVRAADALFFKGTAANYALIIGQELARGRAAKLATSNPVGAIITALFAVYDRNENIKQFR